MGASKAHRLPGKASSCLGSGSSFYNQELQHSGQPCLSRVALWVTQLEWVAPGEAGVSEPGTQLSQQSPVLLAYAHWYARCCLHHVDLFLTQTSYPTLCPMRV